MTRVFSAAGMEEALHALDCVLGSAGGGFCPVWHWHGENYPEEEKAEQAWHRIPYAGSGARLSRFVRMCDENWSDEMHIGMPCLKPDVEHVSNLIPMLWVRVEGKEQLKRARWLKPLPSIVLTEGASSRKLLMWWIRPLDYMAAWDLNRRLAYKLGAVQKHGAPENLRIPLPGTCLRKDRARPVPVVVSRCRPDLYDGDQVAGKLRAPPEVKPGEWRRASNK